jgi:hypothetical protein
MLICTAPEVMLSADKSCQVMVAIKWCESIMVVARDTESMFTDDHETNPPPDTEIVAGRRAELIVVGDTELSRGTGVAPVHSILLPQVARHEIAVTTTTTEMRRATRDILHLPPACDDILGRFA